MKDIRITKSKRKTIYLQIKPDGSIELKVPMQMKEFLHQKSDWIEKHLLGSSGTSAANVTDKTFDNGRNTRACRSGIGSHSEAQIIQHEIDHFSGILI